MNTYIENQCRNMISTVELFEKACELAAQKDDGQISKAEERILKRIHSASKRFKEELCRIE